MSFVTYIFLSLFCAVCFGDTTLQSTTNPFECFVRYNNAALFGHTRFSVIGLSERQCLQSCLTSSILLGFVCRTANFVETAVRSECNLSPIHQTYRPKMVGNLRNGVMFENRCIADYRDSKLDEWNGASVQVSGYSSGVQAYVFLVKKAKEKLRKHLTAYGSIIELPVVEQILHRMSIYGSDDHHRLSACSELSVGAINSYMEYGEPLMVLDSLFSTDRNDIVIIKPSVIDGLQLMGSNSVLNKLVVVEQIPLGNHFDKNSTAKRFIACGLVSQYGNFSLEADEENLSDSNQSPETLKLRDEELHKLFSGAEFYSDADRVLSSCLTGLVLTVYLLL